MDTTIRKCTKSRLYTKISNAALQDDRLSFRARGLIAYILSLPDTWTLCMEHLYTVSPQGRDSIQSAISELKECGYMQHTIIRDAATGRVKGHEWIAYDDPTENPDTAFPHSGKPATIKETSERKEIEQKEQVSGNCPTVLISSEASKQPASKPKPPTWEQVSSFAQSQGVKHATAVRFWQLNEFYGWRTKNSPIRSWKLALNGFAKIDGTKSQKQDKTTNEEFWKWAEVEFDELEMENARTWVDVCTKRGWKKPHKITGEMEPISDYRKSCRAFVDACLAMNINA